MHTIIHKRMTKEMMGMLKNTGLDLFFNQTTVNGHQIADIITQGSYIEDATAGKLDANLGDWDESWESTSAGDNRVPFYHHFWNQNLDEKGMSIGYSCSKPAYKRAQYYWDNFVKKTSSSTWDAYSSEEKEESLLYLGRIIHLLQDMATPAHANDDIHPVEDDFEDYVRSEWDSNITPTKYKYDLSLQFYEDSWNLYDYFYNMASHTILYDSDDVDGKGEGFPYRHDKSYSTSYDLTDIACDAISRRLIPLSHAFTSSFLVYFYKQLDIKNSNFTPSDEKYTVDIKLTGLKVKNDQDWAWGDEGDGILKILNAKQLYTKSLGYESIDGGVYKNLSSEDIHVKRTISKNESMSLYWEVLDKDEPFGNPIDELIGRKKTVINYDVFKDNINGSLTKRYKNNDITLDCRISNFKTDSTRYKVTAYFEKIYVKFDGDPDYWWLPDDYGELYAKCNYNNAQTKIKLGTIGSGEKESIKKKLWSDTFTQGTDFNFTVQVYDHDDASANDSLGILTFDSPLDLDNISKYSNGHTTQYIKTKSPDDCEVKFKFIVEKIKPALKEYKSEKNFIKNTTIYKNVKKLIKRKKTKVDSKFVYYYDENEKVKVLHHENCAHLKKINKKSLKKVYISQRDIIKLKRIKDVASLKPDIFYKKLENNYQKLPLRMSQNFISQVSVSLKKEKINKQNINIIIKEIQNHIKKKFPVQSKVSKYNKLVAKELRSIKPLYRAKTTMVKLEKNKEFKNLKIILKSKKTLSNNIFKKLDKELQIIALHKAGLAEKIEKHKKINKNIDKKKVYNMRKSIRESVVCQDCSS